MVWVFVFVVVGLKILVEVFILGLVKVLLVGDIISVYGLLLI